MNINFNINLTSNQQKAYDLFHQKETKEMLGIIYRDYLCSNEERNKLLKQEEQEMKQYEEELRQKYDSLRDHLTSKLDELTKELDQKEAMIKEIQTYAS